MYLLMLQDKPVLRFDLRKQKFEVLDEKHLPYGLRDAVFPMPEETDRSEYQKYDKYRKDSTRILSSNIQVIDSWMCDRLVETDRVNWPALWHACGEEVTRLELLLFSHGVSATDCYWLKDESDSWYWKDVSVYKNHISMNVALVSLYGVDLKLNCKEITPELTSKGIFPKAWLFNHGCLWLYKNGGKNTETEVMVSRILKNLCVPSVLYNTVDLTNPITHKVETCSRCRNFTDESEMFVTAKDFRKYCEVHDKDFATECETVDYNTYYYMMIIDYLVANPIRTPMDYGFLCGVDTGYVYKMAPLFGFTFAFDHDCIRNPGMPYMAAPYSDMSMRQCARFAVEHVKLDVSDALSRDNFRTKEQYDCFVSRAKELGLA